MPEMSAAAVEVPAALMKVRRLVFFMSSLREEYVGRHDVRVAVRRSRRGLFEERAREDVGVARSDLELRGQGLRGLDVELLPDVRRGRACSDAGKQRAAAGVQTVTLFVQP